MKLSTLNLIRRPATETGFSPVYLAQRRDYNERYSIHAQNARFWRYTAFGCIALATVAISALGYDDSLSKFVPYIVERDHLGDAIAIGAAERVTPMDPRVIQAEINRWIHDVRTVAADAQTERDSILEAYAHTDKSCPAQGQLNEWFRAPPNPPWDRAKTELVTTTIISTLPREANNWKTWVSKWKEEVRSRSGDPIGPPQTKEVSITVNHKQPTTDAQFHQNLSGVFVCEFDWKD